MWRQFAFGVILGVFVGLGYSADVKVALDKPEAGMFLRPMFRGQEEFSLNSLEQPFVVADPLGSVTVKAQYGSFTTEQTVPASWSQIEGMNISNTAIMDSYTNSINISAHIVSRTVTQERPLVAVLFHASSSVTSLDMGHNRIKSLKSPPSDQQWCVQLHVQLHKEELTSVCVVSLMDNVCVAEVQLPDTWWPPQKTTTADVFYSYYEADELGLCSGGGVVPAWAEDELLSASNYGNKDPGTDPTAPPGQNEDPLADWVPQDDDPNMYKESGYSKSPTNPKEAVYLKESSPKPYSISSQAASKQFVSTVTLTYGQVTYQELKEDHHILVYIPQKSFFPGSKFTVPIKLQAESDLQIFVIKVKARHGIRILDAVATDTSRWQVRVDLNHKSKAAMVTASVADTRKYSKMDRVQSIFEFLFEVEQGATGEDRGRLAFTLAYEMNTAQREVYGSVENRVVARLDIQQDSVQAIVPVIKTKELINTAMLTGKVVSVPMKVYSISRGAKVTDITSTTTCHSGDEDVLKVAESCNLVYVDGSETSGAASVSVIAKFGRHSEFLFFKVWVPEFPLDIQLSDDKLSQIKGWKIPIDQSSNRKARGVDFGLLTHPDLLFHEEGLRKEDLDTTCQMRYQQAQVEVYTRFTLDDQDKQQYYVHRKAFFRVTEDVLDRLRVADISVASLKDNIVEGLKPGHTEIQVVTRLGRVIGAQEVRVGPGRVEIKDLEVDVVTGLSMSLTKEPQMDGVLKAVVHRDTELLKNYQEGILDIKVWFDDGTWTPLSQVSPLHYSLESDTLNNHVVAFGPQVSQDMPRIIALGPGKGELLKISLELGGACQRKKTRNLAVSYVYVNIHFDGIIQSDAGHYGSSNRVNNNQYGPAKPGGDKGSIFISVEEHEEMGAKKSSSGYNADDKSGIGRGIAIDDNDFVGPGDSPNSEAQQQLIRELQGMTPLEIGMYVLLAIFCLAIIVFMVNCMIFVARYKRKRKPVETKDPISNVNDWVWIGRATLERNAITTTCSQALMPDADFNGNHSNNIQYLSPPDSVINPPEASSNRNSVISTYKGSECSIRITANPLTANPLPQDPEHTDDVVLEEESSSPAPSTPGHNPSSPPGAGASENRHSAPVPTDVSIKLPDTGRHSAPEISLPETDESNTSSSQLEQRQHSASPERQPLLDKSHPVPLPKVATSELQKTSSKPSPPPYHKSSPPPYQSVTQLPPVQLRPLPPEPDCTSPLLTQQSNGPPLTQQSNIPPLTQQSNGSPSVSDPHNPSSSADSCPPLPEIRPTRQPKHAGKGASETRPSLESRASVPGAMPKASGTGAIPKAPVSRVSCPGMLGFSSDSDDQMSLGRDYFNKEKDSKSGATKGKGHTIILPGPDREKLNDRQKANEACAMDKDSLKRQQREALQVALAESIKAQQDSANGNVANGHISEAEWDYEAMGLTYDQLMDYFDNLKESTA